MTDKKNRLITPDMTILEVVSGFRETESVFHRYDEQAGECLCCQALFESLEAAAQKYRLNIEQFLADLEEAAVRS